MKEEMTDKRYNPQSQHLGWLRNRQVIRDITITNVSSNFIRIFLHTLSISLEKTKDKLFSKGKLLNIFTNLDV